MQFRLPLCETPDSPATPDPPATPAGFIFFLLAVLPFKPAQAVAPHQAPDDNNRKRAGLPPAPNDLGHAASHLSLPDAAFAGRPRAARIAAMTGA
jgi:hypothetical protein